MPKTQIAQSLENLGEYAGRFTSGDGHSLSRSHRFPAFSDSKGRRVTVRVSKEGQISYRTRSGIARSLALSDVWEALQAPDTFQAAIEDLHRSSLRFLEARQLTFAGLQRSPLVNCRRVQLAGGQPA